MNFKTALKSAVTTLAPIGIAIVAPIVAHAVVTTYNAKVAPKLGGSLLNEADAAKTTATVLSNVTNRLAVSTLVS